MLNHSTRTIHTGGKLVVLFMSVGLALGCGGAQKKTGSDGEPPLPPGPAIGQGATNRKPKRDIPKEALDDYKEALAYFQQQDPSGWSKSTCSSAAEKFAQVASKHSKLVEARYMAGLSYHRCAMSDQAEKEYQRALEVDRAHALSMSNLGEIYFQAGKVDLARKYWESALKADGKIVAARNNLAWLILEDLRKNTPGSTQWKKLEKQARDELSRALAVNTDNVKTYVLYALVYIEGWENNRSRLDLAKTLLDEGAKRDDKFAPLHNARGLVQMKRNNQGDALASFRKAVELDPNFVEARMNVGHITLAFRKYDTAEEQFTKVLELQPKNYEATVGLGAAQRGLNKLDAAEASYKKAIELDSNRGTAYFNLGVLYKDFRANSSNDVKASQQSFKQAREYFNTFLSKSDASKDDKEEAKQNISDCDKIIKQLDDVIKAMAQDPSAGGGK